ncbi:MAG: T9SS type A sorting domain-containing protein [Bacteroidota bacterium]|nr:T9SS type A sorting domain-containing protein [Bacteroidota bacterium]
MKKLYSSLLLTCFAATAFAQTTPCDGIRFRDFMFADSTVSNVTYGSNVTYTNGAATLKLDVHMPKMDTAVNRPLIILIHGGNFLGGSKTGADVLQLSKDLAKMGYVAASIDYRVGMTNFPLGQPDSVDAAGSVIRAVHDGKAAVRYFKKDFITNANHYGIDTSQIYVLGVSAGAITGLHMAYMDNISEFPLYADTANHFGIGGALEGNSGNSGYSSSFRGVIGICGALGDSSWIAPGDMPAMFFHGDNDNTVPYGSAVIYLLGTYPLLQVDGSASVAERLDNLGIDNCMETWEGQDHVPEVGTTAPALAYYDSTLTISRNFLVHNICGDALDCSFSNPVGINNLPSLSSLITVYPNPATTNFTVDLGRLAGEDFSIEIIDATGRVVESRTGLGNEKVEFNTSTLSGGIYIVKVNAGESVYLLKQVIE